jgi:biotin-(acetyl-CoA carboxylase) ligase
MPLEKVRSKAQSVAQITLPPPFSLVRLRELGDAFAHAITVAPEQGAGTLVYVGRFDLTEFALVLEPDEPLRLARRALYAGMTALADALIAYAQPETVITIDWPDAIKINEGLVGGGRLAWPHDTGEVDVPPWLVFGGTIRTVSMTGVEPGLTPLATTLADEGFGDEVLSEHVVESFARHFMVNLDAWQQRGFAAVAQRYIEHMPRERAVRRELDDNGDLLTHRKGKRQVERLPLVPHLIEPSWFDPVSKGPRL